MTAKEQAQNIKQLIQDEFFTMEDFMGELRNLMCTHCGRVYEHPSEYCQCWNDE